MAELLPGNTMTTPAVSPCFFFSYSRKDTDSYLRRFFDDLSNAVARKGGLDRAKGAVSFRDLTDIEPGDDWQDEIAKALQHSHVLVCIYTPWYFKREYCGKELAVFLARDPHVRLEAGSYRSSKRIIPLFWIDVRDLKRLGLPPELVRYIQVLDPDPEQVDENSKRGLRHLIVGGGRRKGYWQLVEQLADQILDLALQYPLKPLSQRPALSEVESIFHRSGAQVLGDPSVDCPNATAEEKSKQWRFRPSAGLRVMVLSYVAHDMDVPLSLAVSAACSVSPYRVGLPPLQSGERDVVRSAVDEAASKFRFDCQEIVLGFTKQRDCDNAATLLEEASTKNATIIVVIEPSYAQDHLHAHLIARISKIRCGLKVVLVVLAGSDANSEITPLTSVFDESSDQVLLRGLDRTDPRFEASLADALESLMLEVKRRILLDGKVQRPVDLVGPATIPSIDGPVSRRAP